MNANSINASVQPLQYLLDQNWSTTDRYYARPTGTLSTTFLNPVVQSNPYVWFGYVPLFLLQHPRTSIGTNKRWPNQCKSTITQHRTNNSNIRYLTHNHIWYLMGYWYLRIGLVIANITNFFTYSWNSVKGLQERHACNVTVLKKQLWDLNPGPHH